MGTYESCQWFGPVLRRKYQISTKVVGAGMGFEKDVRASNGKLVWHDGVGNALKAGRGRAEMLINEFATDSTPLKAPTILEPAESDDAKEAEAKQT